MELAPTEDMIATWWKQRSPTAPERSAAKVLVGAALDTDQALCALAGGSDDLDLLRGTLGELLVSAAVVATEHGWTLSEVLHGYWTEVLGEEPRQSMGDLLRSFARVEEIETKVRAGKVELNAMFQQPSPFTRLMAVAHLMMLKGEELQDPAAPENYRSQELTLTVEGREHRWVVETLAPGGLTSHECRRQLSSSAAEMLAALEESGGVDSEALGRWRDDLARYGVDSELSS